MEDLLKDNFTEGVNQRIIKSNFRLFTILLVGVFIYSLLETLQMYRFLNVSSSVFPGRSVLFIYMYRIFPVLALVIIVLNFISMLYMLQGQKLVMSGLEKTDNNLFNKGYLQIKKATIVTIVTCLLSIISTSVWLLLK